MILTVTGRSGTGKDELVKNILTHYPHAQRLQSTTTRLKRPHERVSQYTHVSQEEFKKLQAQKAFLWDFEEDGNWYATSKSTLDEALSSPGLFIAILIPEKVREMRAYAAEHNKENLIQSLYLFADNTDEIRRRMKERGYFEVSIEKRFDEEKKWDEEAKSERIPYFFIDAMQSREACVHEALRSVSRLT